MTRAAPLNDGLINANDFRVGVPYYTTVFDMFFVRCALHPSIHGVWKSFEGVLVMQKRMLCCPSVLFICLIHPVQPASEIREF